MLLLLLMSQETGKQAYIEALPNSLALLEVCTGSVALLSLRVLQSELCYYMPTRPIIPVLSLNSEYSAIINDVCVDYYHSRSGVGMVCDIWLYVCLSVCNNDNFRKPCSRKFVIFWSAGISSWATGHVHI